MELFPADDVNINAGLRSLHKAGFVQLYNCYGTDVIQIVNFAKHQKPHGLEKDSELPSADGLFTIYPRNEKNKTVNGDGVFYSYVDYCNIKGIDINQHVVENHDNNRSETVFEPTNNALNPECGILNPECGMINTETSVSTSDKQKKSKKVLITLPDDFCISERVKNWAIKENHQNLELHLERFRETAIMKQYKYADWDLAFMKAIREDWGKVNIPVRQNNGYQTSQQQTAAEHDKWRLACEPQNNFIDVSPVDQWQGFLNESN